MRFKRIALAGRERPGIATTLDAIYHFLQAKGYVVCVNQDTADMLEEPNLKVVSTDRLSANADIIIVVGGDGSLLKAAKIAVEQNLPVLGINRGRLGFLTDIMPDQLDEILKVLNGEYKEEQRNLLKAEFTDIHGKAYTQAALNDVVLMPGVISQMIEFSLEIDQEFVYQLRADGLIIATPTGSTAYALSGGGPIMQPPLNNLVLVPMFPHTLSSRPLVISGESQICIHISEHNRNNPMISCDGETSITLQRGSKIKICRKENKLRLIHPLSYNYFETLRSKLHWQSKG